MGLFSAAEEAIFDKHRKEKELLVKIKQHSYLVWWSCVDVSMCRAYDVLNINGSSDANRDKSSQNKTLTS